MNDITNHESFEVQDETIPRTYVLCENTEFQVGEADLSNGWGFGNAIKNGQLPIAGRSNIKVQCGDSGSSFNNCTIRDGSFGMFQVRFTMYLVGIVVVAWKIPQKHEF